MKILVINGPNINMLGIREPGIYGHETYSDLISQIHAYCEERHITVECFQSNHEGEIVDCIQKAYQKFDGLVINPAAYTHTSIAIADAIAAVQLPAVEVHISDVSKREAFRQISYVRDVCRKTIMGHGLRGYLKAIDFLCENEKKSV